MAVLSYLEKPKEGDTLPTLLKSSFSYTEWMKFIPRGITPDGLELASICFVDRDDTGDYVSKFLNEEFVGEVEFVGWQFKENGDGYVKLHPGSIHISAKNAPASFVVGRGGVRIRICPLGE